MAHRRTQPVVFQPATHRGLQRGINQLVNAVRPTLGPLPRTVACHQLVTNKMPELLTKGGLIARRIIQLPDRDEDMGAMLVRHLLWSLHQEFGDGTATAAVLFQSVYNQGVHYLASGGNAMQLRRYLEKGAEVILEELSKMTLRVEGKEQLAQIAQSICYDPPLAKMLGEVFDIVGEHGQLEITSFRSRELEREYTDGMYWEAAGLFSREMITDHTHGTVEMENAAILISDLEIEDPRQLLPVMAMAAEAEIRSLLIVSNKLSASAISLLVTNRDPEKFQAIAVKTPGITKEGEVEAIEDVAILTGGRPWDVPAGSGPTALVLASLGARAIRAHCGGT
jgi:chaperonin GroEL